MGTNATKAMSSGVEKKLSHAMAFNLDAAARGMVFFRGCVMSRKQSKTTSPADFATDQLADIYQRVESAGLSMADSVEDPDISDIGMAVLRAFRDWIDEGIRIGEMDGAA